jgi:hypothetical protein
MSMSRRDKARVRKGVGSPGCGASARDCAARGEVVGASLVLGARLGAVLGRGVPRPGTRATVGKGARQFWSGAGCHCRPWGAGARRPADQLGRGPRYRCVEQRRDVRRRAASLGGRLGARGRRFPRYQCTPFPTRGLSGGGAGRTGDRGKVCVPDAGLYMLP